MKLLKDYFLISDEKSFIGYRIGYLVFTWMVTSIILSHYSTLLNGIIPASKFYREFIICGGQLLFQFIVIWFIDKGKIQVYLISMMTISFLAALTLLLFMMVGDFFNLTNQHVYILLFLLTAGAMLLAHIREMKLLEISPVLSVTWVLYRIFVLIIILTGS